VNKSTSGCEINEVHPGVLAQGFLGDEFRLLDRYELQSELVDTLGQTENHRHLVPKVARCHRSFRHWRCDQSHDWAEAENSCSMRLCPHCSRRRSLILAGRVEAFVMGKTNLRYVVLAERNSADLAEGMLSLWIAWRRLRRWKRWKAKVKGAIVVMEVTRNRDDGTWHPHLNLLLEGEYFPFEELNQAWIEATHGFGQTSWISAADEGTVRELIKYVTKISDLLGDPAALDEFLSAVQGRRMIRTYGTFRGISVADEENPQTGRCPDCGPTCQPSVVDLGHVHPSQVSLDFDGVLRVDRPQKIIEAKLHDAAAFPPALPPEIRFRPLSSLARLWDRVNREARDRSREQQVRGN
jgi:Replication protein/Transposase zinc-binding domain